MVAEIVPCYPTYGKGHSPFYESYHRDYDFSLFSAGYYFFWGIVPQGDFLRYVVFLFKGFYLGRTVH